MPSTSSLLYLKEANTPHLKALFGGRTYYVGATSALFPISASDEGTGEPGSDTYGVDPRYPFATLSYALGLCVSGRGDTIYVLPNYTQDIDAAADLAFSKNGVSVIGIGVPGNRPVLTWTTTANATITVAGAGVTFENMTFDLTGVDEVVTGFSVSGADFTMKDCRVYLADSGGQCVAGVTLGTSDQAKFIDCEFLGDTANGTANCKAITGGACTNLRLVRCYFDLISGATVGCVAFTGAATGFWAENCHFANRIASATTTVGCAANAVVGAMKNCTHVLGTIATAGSGIIPVTSTGQAAFVASFENYVVNDQDAAGAGEAGALVGTAST